MLPGCDEKPELRFTESRPRGSAGSTARSGLLVLHRSKLPHRKHVQTLCPEFTGVSG